MTTLDLMYLTVLILPAVPPLHTGVRLEQAQFHGSLARFDSHRSQFSLAPGRAVDATTKGDRA
jgi:hypothetical protein